MSGRFVKHNPGRYPDQLLQEARGLDALRRAAAGSGIDVPEVLHVDEHTLSLPFIRGGAGSAEQWGRLGAGLARLHAQPQPRFGFDTDNYIGLNPQPNAWSDSWGEFFVRRRLEFQVGRIADPARRRGYAQRLQARAVRLREFLDASAVVPSLVHGDLWHGNVLCSEDGRVWLIDPAVYCGDAEVDLAMTGMFGGFPEAFHAAYRARRPAPADATARQRIYNLYHYINHLNLFGEAYLDGCEAGLAAIEAL